MSRVMQIPFALLGFLGLVAVVPVWVHFYDAYSGPLTTEAEFLAGLILPMMIALFLASWVQPRGSGR